MKFNFEWISYSCLLYKKQFAKISCNIAIVIQNVYEANIFKYIRICQISIMLNEFRSKKKWYKKSFIY